MVGSVLLQESGASITDARIALDNAYRALESGDCVEARAYLRLAEPSLRRENRHRFLVARCTLDEGAYAAAIEEFDALQRDAPNYEPASNRNNVGFALSKLGR